MIGQDNRETRRVFCFVRQACWRSLPNPFCRHSERRAPPRLMGTIHHLVPGHGRRSTVAEISVGVQPSGSSGPPKLVLIEHR